MSATELMAKLLDILPVSDVCVRAHVRVARGEDAGLAETVVYNEWLMLVEGREKK